MDEYGVKLRELRENHTIKQMAEILDCSERTVTRHLAKYNISSEIGRTDIQDSDVLDFWNNGLTVIEIAQRYNCSHETISKRLLKYNIISDRTSGIKKHFERVHADLWPDIKQDLDNGMSIYSISRKYQMRYDSVVRLMERQNYEKL